MSSVLELLSQAAQSGLDEQERQVEQVAPVLKRFFYLQFKVSCGADNVISDVYIHSYSTKDTCVSLRPTILLSTFLHLLS